MLLVLFFAFFNVQREGSSLCLDGGAFPAPEAEPSPPQPHLVFAAHPAEPRLTALPGFVIIMEKNPLGIPTRVLLLVLLCPVGLGGSGRAVQ